MSNIQKVLKRFYLNVTNIKMKYFRKQTVHLLSKMRHLKIKKLLLW